MYIPIVIQSLLERNELGSFVKIPGKILHGVFYERPNRFLARVKVKNAVHESFVPNPGRMRELLTVGANVILLEVLKAHRKTRYDLIGVFFDDQIVSIDSRVPNKLVYTALQNHDLPEFSQYHQITPEYTYGDTRFDFLLTNRDTRCFLEVKSCTLVKDGVAMFPDAPTERGRKHLNALIKAQTEGYRACILFLIQRSDATLFTPNIETDPKFSQTLSTAVLEGVEAYAYHSEFTGTLITLRDKVKVTISQ